MMASGSKRDLAQYVLFYSGGLGFSFMHGHYLAIESQTLTTEGSQYEKVGSRTLTKVI